MSYLKISPDARWSVPIALYNFISMVGSYFILYSNFIPISLYVSMVCSHFLLFPSSLLLRPSASPTCHSRLLGVCKVDISVFFDSRPRFILASYRFGPRGADFQLVRRIGTGSFLGVKDVGVSGQAPFIAKRTRHEKF
jgi:hypothetical protein